MPQVASRYAKSLIDTAIEKGQLEQVNTDMKMVLVACRKLKDLSLLLKSPLIKTDKKIKIFREIFKDQISQITEEFIILVTKNRREAMLETIAEDFIEQYKVKMNIITATVTSAVKLDTQLLAQMKEVLNKSYHATIEIVEKIDQRLIGGFILRIGDKEADLSVQRQLNQLRKNFNQSYLLN
ncbi:MAG: ATP synthase F1 subunit delta [Bacteroidia bacterium]|nr:ATP synthase F1 subunit delta [Bacteroidia bacterium]